MSVIADGTDFLYVEETLSVSALLTTEDWLRIAYREASKSRDRSCQNGAIVSDGYSAVPGFNDIPRGVQDLEERHTRPLKYSFVRHAERSAIYNAARAGVRTRGSTMYCPWFACSDCAIAIIESGITHVVGHKQRMDLSPERWLESIKNAFVMLDEAGVTYEFYDGPLGANPILVDGQLWTP